MIVFLNIAVDFDILSIVKIIPSISKNLISLPVFLAIMAVSCVATKKATDYSQISVPQEGGYQYKQITSEDQIIWGPRVINNAGKLSWYTGSMFDISDNGESLVYISSTSPDQKEGNV